MYRRLSSSICALISSGRNSGWELACSLLAVREPESSILRILRLRFLLPDGPVATTAPSCPVVPLGLGGTEETLEQLLVDLCRAELQFADIAVSLARAGLGGTEEALEQLLPDLRWAAPRLVNGGLACPLRSAGLGGAGCLLLCAGLGGAEEPLEQLLDDLFKAAGRLVSGGLAMVRTLPWARPGLGGPEEQLEAREQLLADLCCLKEVGFAFAPAAAMGANAAASCLFAVDGFALARRNASTAGTRRRGSPQGGAVGCFCNGANGVGADSLCAAGALAAGFWAAMTSSDASNASTRFCRLRRITRGDFSVCKVSGVSACDGPSGTAADKLAHSKSESCCAILDSIDSISEAVSETESWGCTRHCCIASSSCS